MLFARGGSSVDGCSVIVSMFYQLALIQSLRNFTFTAGENCSICNVFAPRCWLVSPFFGFFWMGNHILLLIF